MSSSAHTFNIKVVSRKCKIQHLLELACQLKKYLFVPRETELYKKYLFGVRKSRSKSQLQLFYSLAEWARASPEPCQCAHMGVWKLYPGSRFRLRASLVAQWLRICLLMQGTQVRALVWEDPTCRGATRPVSHNCWACASGAHAPQQERPR